MILGLLFFVLGFWVFASPVATFVTLAILFSIGFIVSGALENSNVDIAAELTRMIESQRTYTANSKVFQISLSAGKGEWPVRAAYNTPPKPYTSVLSVRSRPSMAACSGEQ